RDAGLVLHRTLHIIQTDRTNLALGLRDDMGRPQAANQIGIYFIDAERGRNALLYQPIDLQARSGYRNGRAGTDRKIRNAKRVIAFVRSSDLELAESQGVHDLGGARNQRKQAQVVHNSLVLFQIVSKESV